MRKFFPILPFPQIAVHITERFFLESAVEFETSGIHKRSFENFFQIVFMHASGVARGWLGRASPAHRRFLPAHGRKLKTRG